MNTTPLLYRKYMYMYGILSLLFVLEYFESIENYEECKKIIDSIRESEKNLNCTLYTRITDNTISEIKKTYHESFGLSGEMLYVIQCIIQK